MEGRDSVWIVIGESGFELFFSLKHEEIYEWMDLNCQEGRKPSKVFLEHCSEFWKDAERRNILSLDAFMVDGIEHLEWLEWLGLGGMVEATAVRAFRTTKFG